MRTVAALTMIMAIVVAAIPVENYGSMLAADGQSLGDITNDLTNTSAYYNANTYENGYTTEGTVQRIRVDSNGNLSLVDMFKIKRISTGTNAIITEDIIGDGSHQGETELTINQVEYCNYVQFDPDFIRTVSDSLANKKFELTFQQDVETKLEVPSSLSSGTAPITVKTIRKDNPNSVPVEPTISITNNNNAQGYTSFGNVKLDASTMYSQDFGKTLYDAKIAEIDSYNARVNAFITKVNAFITRVSANNYTWNSTTDTNEWNSYVTEAAGFAFDSTTKLSNEYTDFRSASNGLNNIVDYIIRNYCKKGNSDLTKYQLRSMLRQDENGDIVTVYVPQYTESGTHDWLDDNNFLPATSESRVWIKGIASYDTGTGHTAFYKTTLNKITLPQGIQFIGKSAFADSNLTEVTINTTACEIIGEEAFAECTSLATVNFSYSGAVASNRFITIDKKAFYHTGITSVTIPSPVTKIGAGAFAGSQRLSTVTFDDTSRGNDITIEKYAFYDCNGLTAVNFPTNNTSQYIIKKGAFALKNPGGSLNSFTFPGGNVDINYGGNNDVDEYDYILENRKTLKEVTFPGKLKSDVPDNTLTNCNNLSWVKFPEGANYAGYNSDKLFADVWGDPGFYVEGPELLNQPGSRSNPRETTWKAKAGKTGNDSSGNPVWALPSVPYKFTDSNGKIHFEIGVSDENGDLQYIANIEVIDGNNASLVSYFPYKKDTTVEKVWITIPTEVGGYNVVSIEPGCFDDAENLKNNITRLSIGDSITDIKTGAFKAMPELQWVDIGSGVSRIESGAFAECEKLENVVFSQAITGTLPEDSVEYWQELKIADDAFKTNSDRLTFHGAINPEYAPFKIAMSPNNSDLLKRDTQICYKTDEPLNLTVIRNRNDGKATLVNYPHYEDMDDEIVAAFEAVYINGSGTEDDRNKLDSDAGRAIMQTLNMNLPSGIESIDSKSFFAAESKNDLDFEYIDHYYKQNKPDSKTQSDYEWKLITDKKVNPNDSAINDLMSLYSKDAYVADKNYAALIGETAYENNTPNQDRNNYIVATGGLFSGGFKEAASSSNTDSVIWTAPYENHTYKETYPSGNDYLTSINMSSIKELPKFAFDSCENLLTVAFNAVESMGDLPFRGCKSLYQIDTGKSKYVFQNMLLYETKQDGSYEIVQCLEGRGMGQGDNGHYYYTGSVTSKGEEDSNSTNVDSNLANVTSIRAGAFSNCSEITEVDLTDSKISNVPQRAFENCENLFQVTLPDTTMGIDQKAFKGAADRNLYVTIKNPNCTIAVDAFDFDTTKEVFIRGISTDDKGNESTCHYNYRQIKDELDKSGKDGSRIHFSEADSTCILTFVDDKMNVIDTVEVAKNTPILSNPPTAPAKTGYKFSYWMCTNVRDENNNALIGAAAYSNVTEDRTIMAIYEEDKSSIVPDGKEYNLTVVNGAAMINGTMVTTFPAKVTGGTSVAIMANDTTNFRVWTIIPSTSISLLLNPSSSATSFTMPNADVTVTANSAIGGGTNTPNPDGTYTVTVNNGTGGGNYRPGATVTITANTPNTGASFVNWTTTTSGVTFANATSASTTFVMPSSNVSVTANFSDGTGGQPGGNTPGGDNTTKYKVTVNYGSGSGEYAAGETVNITANAPESSNRVFSRWTTSNSGLGFANANAVSTSFVMPATDVTVTANYKTRTSDDDDDDDDDSSSSRRPGTNTSTNTVTNTPGSSTNTTGTTGTVNNPSNESGSTTGTNNTNGNRIYITKNGISNTDVASLAVSGSTDNFIVRITESAEATAAVEQALTNTYGSLSGLAYLPMDISLYDSTGQNKITDTTGLNITVTMPIPDVLIQYGGNARVAAADNGNLVQLTPRFTTIDGIACISFVPPHFSPYVIYVDTNNLIAGQMLDSTPATGDPIHPKWFAAIGMACVSILLFVTSDGRKRKKFRAA